MPSQRDHKLPNRPCRRFAMVTEGLPGPAYHGGAVAQWAVLQAMRQRGHEVVVVGLIDPANPYSAHRDEQVRQIEAAGAEVLLVEFSAEQRRRARTPAKPPGLLGRITRLFDPAIYDLDTVFDGLAAEAVAGLRVDAIFCYHFETVAALGSKTAAPVTVCAVDLMHLPSLERWRGQPHTLAKWTRDLIFLAGYSHAMKTRMTQLFRRCAVKVEFAPHYARWFRDQPGCADTLYIPTPVHDPMGKAWKAKRDETRKAAPNAKPRLLMIGDVTGTATAAGLRLCRDAVFPMLERELGADGFEVRLVGGGTLAPEFASFADKPYITMPGRVVPPDPEFLSADLVLVPTPNTLGVRVRIVNAFSYGACVVAHVGNQAGIPEMQHDDNCLIAEDGPGLARQCLRVIRESGLAERIGSGGRACFERHFATEIAGARIVDAMEASVMAGESP